MLVTCQVQVVDTRDGHVLIMITVINTPSIVSAIHQRSFITSTVDLIHQNISCSRIGLEACRNTEFPVWKRCNLQLNCIHAAILYPVDMDSHSQQFI